MLHVAKLLRSCWRERQSDISETFLKHLASSANSKTSEEVTAAGRSFTNTKNMIGPKMLPCGTPETTGRTSETELLTETH